MLGNTTELAGGRQRAVDDKAGQPDRGRLQGSQGLDLDVCGVNVKVGGSQFSDAVLRTVVADEAGVNPSALSSPLQPFSLRPSTGDHQTDPIAMSRPGNGVDEDLDPLLR